MQWAVKTHSLLFLLYDSKYDDCSSVEDTSIMINISDKQYIK